MQSTKTSHKLICIEFSPLGIVRPEATPAPHATVIDKIFTDQADQNHNLVFAYADVE